MTRSSKKGGITPSASRFSSPPEGMYELTFASWVDFKTNMLARVREVQESCWAAAKDQRRRFLFRGQACSSWPLWSSFDRVMEDGGITGRDIERHYLNMLREFVINGIEMEILEEELRVSPDVPIDVHFRQRPEARLQIETYAQH